MAAPWDRHLQPFMMVLGLPINPPGGGAADQP